MSQSDESTASSILTHQILIRISKEEYEAWTHHAAENHVHVNIFVRRVMAIALKMQPTVARIERLVVEAKKKRAEHMRSFKKGPKKADASAPVRQAS